MAFLGAVVGFARAAGWREMPDRPSEGQGCRCALYGMIAVSRALGVVAQRRARLPDSGCPFHCRQMSARIHAPPYPASSETRLVIYKLAHVASASPRASLLARPTQSHARAACWTSGAPIGGAVYSNCPSKALGVELTQVRPRAAIPVGTSAAAGRERAGADLFEQRGQAKRNIMRAVLMLGGRWGSRRRRRGGGRRPAARPAAQASGGAARSAGRPKAGGAPTSLPKSQAQGMEVAAAHGEEGAAGAGRSRGVRTAGRTPPHHHTTAPNSGRG